MSPRERGARIWIWIVAGAALAALGCGTGKDADAHYAVRGEVVSVSKLGTGTYAVIHHERIAAFKDRDGQASPMESMQMNFLLGPGVDATAFKPGAKLALELDVRWRSGDALVITRAAPLADATPLALGEH